MADFSNYKSTVTVPNLTKIVRHAVQAVQGFNQLCNPPSGAAIGKNNGDTNTLVFYPELANEGSELNEYEDIPMGDITPFRVEYTIKEYGYGIPTTEKLEYLSQIEVENNLTKALSDQLKKTQNSLAFAEFDATKWIVNLSASGNEFRTDGVAGSFSNTSNKNVDFAGLQYIVRQAKLNNIPTYDGESYVLVTGVNTCDNIRYDSTVTTSMSNSGMAKEALNGEVGRLAGCRIIEENHKATQLLNISASEGILDKTYLVGADAVLNEYALAPEIRYEEEDFGRIKKIAYIFNGAWKKIYSQASNSREHVIKVAVKP